jgi:hypothetical protein
MSKQQAKSVSVVEEKLKALATVDLFKKGRDQETFVGRPFYFDYSKVKLLVNDKWKNRVGGLPEGAFLLCAYVGETEVEEMVLLRVLGPTSLPSDSDVVASMVEYYKEGVPEGKAASPKLDTFTRYEFMFSGLECRVLGTFYRGEDGKPCFGADIDNFYSPHNYEVFKPKGQVLEFVVNFREGEGISGGADQVPIGHVRYSASRRHPRGSDVPVYVSAFDFVGKRTALFGMTRTGKSNTVKKLIHSTVELSARTPPPRMEGVELQPIGQIIFDINGEYANPNQQDEGTAVFEMFKENTTRYSLLEKPGFEVMKLNFYRDIEPGFSMIQNLLADDGSAYVRSFCSIDLQPPDVNDRGPMIRYERLIAAYQACLVAAGFDPGTQKIRFEGHKELNSLSNITPGSAGLDPNDAIAWFSAVWANYNTAPYLVNYPSANGGRQWANEDLKAVLAMLTRTTTPGGNANVAGFRKLQPLRQYHSSGSREPFEEAIVRALRQGGIVIIDLSQGDPLIQSTYSERVCRRIFTDAMRRFIENKQANFIQLYFEEAHNLFPKKDDKDLSQIYNRIAKEGAKLRLGLVYATQEASSISSNVLKNTQNWFVSHLNNSDELREIDKYYDFGDFVDSLRRTSDRGFIRMKTYSNAFVVPVQIDRFTARGA